MHGNEILICSKKFSQTSFKNRFKNVKSGSGLYGLSIFCIMYCTRWACAGSPNHLHLNINTTYGADIYFDTSQFTWYFIKSPTAKLAVKNDYNLIAGG